MQQCQIIKTRIGRSREERIAAIHALGSIGGVESQNFLLEIIDSKPIFGKEERVAAINTLGIIKLI